MNAILRSSEIKINWLRRQPSMLRITSKVWFANYCRSKETELDRFRSPSRLCNFPESEIIDTRSFVWYWNCLEVLVSYGAVRMACCTMKCVLCITWRVKRVKFVTCHMSATDNSFSFATTFSSAHCHRPTFCISFSYIPQRHYDPGVDSASNRNEYQESSWGVRLTTLLPSVSRLSR
jgi:hypothetical protein